MNRNTLQKFTFLILMLCCPGASVQAEEICRDVAHCQALYNQTQARLTLIAKRIEELLEPVSLTDLIETKSTWEEAMAYCEKFHAGLPTVRQLALGINPQGVSSTPVEGSWPIRDYYGDVEFYFNRSSAASTHMLWSSTKMGKNGIGVMEVYIFSGYDGLLHIHRSNDKMFFRCLLK